MDAKEGVVQKYEKSMADTGILENVTRLQAQVRFKKTQTETILRENENLRRQIKSFEASLFEDTQQTNALNDERGFEDRCLLDKQTNMGTGLVTHFGALSAMVKSSGAEGGNIFVLTQRFKEQQERNEGDGDELLLRIQTCEDPQLALRMLLKVEVIDQLASLCALIAASKKGKTELNEECKSKIETDVSCVNEVDQLERSNTEIVDERRPAEAQNTESGEIVISKRTTMSEEWNYYREARASGTSEHEGAGRQRGVDPASGASNGSSVRPQEEGVADRGSSPAA